MKLNEYIDYRQMFNDIRDKHLEVYPTKEDFIDNYLGEDIIDIDINSIKHINKMYVFLNDKSYTDGLDVCNETSFVNSESGELIISLVEDNSTNTECGYEADFVLFILDVDTDTECFCELIIDN